MSDTAERISAEARRFGTRIAMLAGQPAGALVLAAVVALFALSLTYLAWESAQAAARQELRDEFHYRVQDLAERITRRMNTYEQVLRGVKGFVAHSVDVDRRAFRDYVDTLHLEEHYPGIQGVALARVVEKSRIDEHERAIRAQGFPDYAIRPAGERETYTAITLIEPFSPMNRRAFGYDMYSEPVRRAAMARARDTGRAALSSRVTLVQESGASPQAGFLMYLPIYRAGASLQTVDERRSALIGWVYAPFRINDFMAGLESARSADWQVEIRDAQSPDDAVMYRSNSAPPARSPMFEVDRSLSLGGHGWRMTVTSTPVFEERMESEKPRAIAIGGVATSLLLAALVWMLARGRGRAQALALEMTHELRESHARIAAEQRRIAAILDCSYDAFVAIDADGRITDWNSRAAQMFGWSEKEAVGRDLAELLVPPALRQSGQSGFRRFYASDAGPVLNNRIEIEALRRDGSTIPVELAVTAVQTDAGYFTSAFLRDQSEQKAAAAREAERQAALDQARRALVHAQKLEAVGKLTGGVAHDFNNVLQIIGGNLQLLLNDSRQTRDVRERLNAALGAVDRGAKLSSQLLAYARRQPLQPAVINPARLLRDMDELLRHALGEGIETQSVAAAGLWNTLVDPHQLENVILNLAINARDAMGGRGRFTIELNNAVLDEEYVAGEADLAPGQYVMLAVSDSGPGMAPEVAERAFEPFFTTKPVGQGTGLGLSMAYGFVKQSGGHIRLYSEIGHGTTIKIYLPRSLAEAASAPPRPESSVRSGSETILVVEDDIGVQAAVVDMLGGLGYRVLSAHDGAAALQILQSGQTVDLLFTDVVMPGDLTGPELAARARALAPDIAVLYTSGYTQNAIVHGGRLDPGVELLSKPYRREQLARKIRQVLDSRPQAGAPEPPAADKPALDILLVEDNPDMLSLAGELLGMLGHRPTASPDAERALQLLGERRYHVLFADIGLPGMDGIELARRAGKIQPGLKIVFATGYGDTAPDAAGLDATVLVKPYDLEQLQEALAE